METSEACLCTAIYVHDAPQGPGLEEHTGKVGLHACRDGHGYACVDQGPSLGGFAGSGPEQLIADLFDASKDDEVELEKSNVLLLGPTGAPRISHTGCEPSRGFCGAALLLEFGLCA